jgi:threonine/homoserine/homoserine lactone efflux protein
MGAELLLAFGAFAFVTSITPGPNNVMVLASGVNHGFVRTLPHIAGISLGCALMTVLVGFGLGELLAASPLLYAVLRYAGAAYLLVLAWRIARSGLLPTGTARGRPIGFLQAAAFQWLNPKAWVMVMGAVTTYAPRDGFMRNVCVIAAVLVLINAPSVAAWAGFGVALRQALGAPGRVRAFNIAMALLLVLSLFPMLEH